MAEQLLHECDRSWVRHGGFGGAIEWVTRGSDGVWFVDNGEYQTTVRFCPFCGVDLTAIEEPDAR